MCKNICLTILFFIFIGTTSAKSSINLSKSCDIKTILLTGYKKNDLTFVSKSCDFNENPFVENNLKSDKQTIFVNKYNMDGGKWPQELAAISIYKNRKKNPILITLHTQNWDTPTINGVTYSINLYEIINSNGQVKLIDISRTLGDNQHGLDGESDQKMVFKLKNIFLIKKWLDEKYK